MNKRTKLTSQDPTFEKQGPMYVFLCNQTDKLSLGLYPSNATLTYGSSPTPPPPWVLGKDWQVLGSYLTLPPWQLTQGPPLKAGSVGSASVIAVANRGNSRVALDGEYVFDQRFYIGNTGISIHFTVYGLAGGSIVLPGFGLFNLSKHPNAWTYVVPNRFDGSWSIQLRSPDFFNFVTLSISYIPYGLVIGLGTLSRLFYSISGSGTLFAGVQFPSSKKDKPALSSGNELQKESPIEIFGASGKYRLHASVAKPKGGKKKPMALTE